MLFMKYFKLDPVNLMDILTQSLWLNNNVITNKELLYWKTWEGQGISQLKDILNNHNLYLTHEELKNKYNIRTTFLDTLNIQNSIPTDWIKQIKNSSIKVSKEPNNLIFINNRLVDLEKCKCNEFYWHILNLNIKTPRAVYQWQKIFQPLENVDSDFWKSIYKMPFKTVRDTQIQSFQFRIIHRTIACNEWLNNLTIKSTNKCNFCEHKDSIIHFFINCEKTNQFWKTWALWWKRLTGFDITIDNCILECIIFGFPGSSQNIKLINYCILYAKYFIYKNKMNGIENIGFLGYLSYLK